MLFFWDGIRRSVQYSSPTGILVSRPGSGEFYGPPRVIIPGNPGQETARTRVLALEFSFFRGYDGCRTSDSQLHRG